MNRRMQRLLAGHRLYREPATGGDGGEGGGGGGEGNTEGAGGEGQSGSGEGGEGGEGAAGDKKPKVSDAEAKLLKEVMKLKDAAKKANDKLQAYEGIDAEKARKLLADAQAAEVAAQEAERKRLEEAGNFDAVKKQMVEQHTAQLSEKDTALKQAQDDLAAAHGTIAELTVGAAFSNSKYLADEFASTPRKARQLYGSQFEYVDGKIVGYDKPAGEKDRAPLVDAKGEPLSFEAAIAKIVDSDPDKDTLKKSKMKPGAASSTANATGTQQVTNSGTSNDPSSGLTKIQQALRAQKK
jgi:hypothetical protein